MRSQIPATYNVARVYEAPIPPVRVSNIRCAESTDGETDQEESEHIEDEVENESGHIEIKVEFQQVELDDVDVSALDDIFSLDGDDMKTDATGTIDVAESDAEQRNEAAPLTSPTTEKFDDSDDELEFTFSSSTDFMPYQAKDGYILKLDDLLTDHFPFKLNVIIRFPF